MDVEQYMKYVINGYFTQLFMIDLTLQMWTPAFQSVHFQSKIKLFREQGSQNIGVCDGRRIIKI